MATTSGEAAAWLNPAEAAVRAKRSEYTVLRWVRDGVIPAEAVRRDRLTRRLSIRADALDAVTAGEPIAPASAG